jgi:GNAT superfamily N-acetyltransferase
MPNARSDQPRIRRATAADAATIAHQRSCMFLDMGQLAADEVEAVERVTHEQLEPLLASGEYLGWVVEIDGAVVAGAGVFLHRLLPRLENPDGRPEAYVLNVYTDPVFRRRGLARKLMETIRDWCAEEGLPRVSLHASNAGRPMYEQLGFRVSNEMRLEIGSDGRR